MKRQERILTDHELVSALAIWIADHLNDPVQVAARSKEHMDLFCRLETIIERWITIHERKL